MGKPDISQFTKSRLEVYDFPGTDAAVVFVPDGLAPPDHIRTILERSSNQQWYPVPGGHNAKIPWHYVIGSESYFTREAMGWNHEHCDYYNSNVNMNERCWTAELNGGLWLFCKKCHDTLPEK